jgi:hypothetical protein
MFTIGLITSSHKEETTSSQREETTKYRWAPVSPVFGKTVQNTARYFSNQFMKFFKFKQIVGIMGILFRIHVYRWYLVKPVFGEILVISAKKKTWSREGESSGRIG